MKEIFNFLLSPNEWNLHLMLLKEENQKKEDIKNILLIVLWVFLLIQFISIFFFWIFSSESMFNLLKQWFLNILWIIIWSIVPIFIWWKVIELVFKTLFDRNVKFIDWTYMNMVSYTFSIFFSILITFLTMLALILALFSINIWFLNVLLSSFLIILLVVIIWAIYSIFIFYKMFKYFMKEKSSILSFIWFILVYAIWTWLIMFPIIALSNSIWIPVS